MRRGNGELLVHGAAQVPGDATGWMGRYAAAVVLAVTVAGLAVGGGLRLGEARGPGDTAWLAVSACRLGYAAWAMADSLLFARRSSDLLDPPAEAPPPALVFVHQQRACCRQTGGVAD